MHSLVIRVLILAVGICAQSLKDVEELESICGMDSVLRCNAKAKCKPGVQYRAVRWYKVSEEPSHKLSGLLARDLSPPNNITRRYTGLQREVQLLDDSLDILLPNVTFEDSGKYRCFLAAPIGEQNQLGEVRLRVAGCPDNKSTDQSEEGDIFLVLAIVLLVVALLIFTISYPEECINAKEQEKPTGTASGCTPRKEGLDIDLYSRFKLGGKSCQDGKFLCVSPANLVSENKLTGRRGEKVQDADGNVRLITDTYQEKS